MADAAEPTTTTSQSPADPSSNTNTSDSTSPSTGSSSGPPPKLDPSSLPSEALALASRLFDLARAGDTTSLAPYLHGGIPVNLTNQAGDTLLMLAAYHGHAAAVGELLRRGADADALNQRGQSPMAGAVFKGYDDVVEVLVRQGKADVRAGQPNAVDCAVMFKRDECLRIMGISKEDEQAGQPRAEYTG